MEGFSHWGSWWKACQSGGQRGWCNQGNFGDGVIRGTLEMVESGGPWRWWNQGDTGGVNKETFGYVVIRGDIGIML